MFANLFAPLIRWWNAPSRPWYESEALSAGDPFVMTAARIRQIEVRQNNLSAEISRAIRRKAKRSHLLAEMKRLTTERLELERLWRAG